MKLKLETTIQRIEVFYDGHCGMCSSFVEWLVAQERAIEVVCLPYQTDEAVTAFPELLELKPEREMIVRIDGEDFYRGAEGWVWCLWSCAKYQDVSKLVNTRMLLPMAKKVCYLVSKNRLRVSKLLFGKKAKAVAEELHQLEVDQSECDDGKCDL